MKKTLHILAFSFFSSWVLVAYTGPGIILLMFIGLLPVCIAILTILKKKISAWLIAIQGVILMGWKRAFLTFESR